MKPPPLPPLFPPDVRAVFESGALPQEWSGPDAARVILQPKSRPTGSVGWKGQAVVRVQVNGRWHRVRVSVTASVIDSANWPHSKPQVTP